MDEEIRKQPIQLSCFAGNKPYCIFCKIEEGKKIQQIVYSGDLKLLKVRSGKWPLLLYKIQNFILFANARHV